MLPSLPLSLCYLSFSDAGHLLAQSGGAIAGASVMLAFYGTFEEAQTRQHEAVFGLEFLLTFMIVLLYLRVTEHSDNLMASVAIGISYMTANTAFRGAVNPAFALGRSFVENDFDHLWLFWLGPLLGGTCAALCHEYIFNEQKDVHLSLTNLSTSSNQDTDNEEPDIRFNYYYYHHYIIIFSQATGQYQYQTWSSQWKDGTASSEARAVWI